MGDDTIDASFTHCCEQFIYRPRVVCFVPSKVTQPSHRRFVMSGIIPDSHAGIIAFFTQRGLAGWLLLPFLVLALLLRRRSRQTTA